MNADEEEPCIHIQTWICPNCCDDHNSGIICPEFVKLRSENERLQEENEKIKQDPSAVTAWKLLLTEDENKSLCARLNEAREMIETTGKQLEILQINFERYKTFESWQLHLKNVLLVARAWLEKNK